MSRYLFTLPADRSKVLSALDCAPFGTRIEMKGARRTLPQNDRLWAMLTDVATQKEHCGRKYTPDQWKVLFMHACGREVQFIPSLDRTTLIPWGQSSRDLSKEEMSELIELMFAWGSENGVQFHEPASGIMAPREPDAGASDDLLARPEPEQIHDTLEEANDHGRLDAPQWKSGRRG